MQIAHLADLHLDVRAGTRLTPDGRNQREQDVSDAYATVVDQVIAAQPDLVLIAGDVFHGPRPHMRSLTDACRGLLRLRQALPRVPVLIVEGNHDQPGVDGYGSPLETLALLGAKVVVRAERVGLPALGCHVLGVPDRDIRRVALTPGPEPGTHLLLAHGSIGGRLATLPGAEVLPADAIAPDFVYAALGDYHVTEQVAPNAWYAGAIEYTSSDPWRELGAPKGWLLVDTDAGTVAHQAVPTRRHLDLPRIGAQDLTAADLTTRILEQVAQVDVAGAVVRQVVTDCLRGTREAVDRRAIRHATRDALSFQLDIRRPEQVGRPRGLPIADEGPDWIDALNAEDVPAPQGDAEYSLADTFCRGGTVTREQLLADPDPYHLEAPRVSAAA